MMQFDKIFNELMEQVSGVYGSVKSPFTGVPEGDNAERHHRKEKAKARSKAKHKPAMNNQKPVKAPTYCKSQKLPELVQCPYCQHAFRNIPND